MPYETSELILDLKHNIAVATTKKTLFICIFFHCGKSEILTFKINNMTCNHSHTAN